jgi:hypothetical protein
MHLPFGSMFLASSLSAASALAAHSQERHTMVFISRVLEIIDQRAKYRKRIGFSHFYRVRPQRLKTTKCMASTCVIPHSGLLAPLGGCCDSVRILGECALRARGGAMFRKDWSKRPAPEAYEDLVLNQCWTRVPCKVNAQGYLRDARFLGHAHRHS